jgi:hypothetical protein
VVEANDVTVAEDEHALPVVTVLVANMAIVRAKFDGGEHHADVQDVEGGRKQRRAPIQHDLGAPTASITEH